jgi:organic radical activating enzyme
VAWGVPAIVDALLDPSGGPRDGYTVLGGEPFGQPDGVAAVLEGIRAREPDAHITVYSGHYLETLLRRPEPSVRRILELASLLIDGPFVASLRSGAGEWRGSTNQRLLALAPAALPPGWQAERAFPAPPIRTSVARLTPTFVPASPTR